MVLVHLDFYVAFHDHWLQNKQKIPQLHVHGHHRASNGLHFISLKHVILYNGPFIERVFC